MFIAVGAGAPASRSRKPRLLTSRINACPPDRGAYQGGVALQMLGRLGWHARAEARCSNSDWSQCRRIPCRRQTRDRTSHCRKRSRMAATMMTDG